MEDYIKYKWPSSALKREHMIMLSDLRDDTGVPITKLIREAVEFLFDAHMKAVENVEVLEAGHVPDDQGESSPSLMRLPEHSVASQGWRCV